jgi:hypothetical protein
MPIYLLLLALGCSPSGAALYAPHVSYWAPRFGVDEDIAAAVLARESHCRPWVQSRAGDHGGWQLRPGAATLGKHAYTEEQLHMPSISTVLALRWLAIGREKCGPLLMLGWYGSGKCGPTKYAKRIKARLARAKRQCRQIVAAVAAEGKP